MERPLWTFPNKMKEENANSNLVSESARSYLCVIVDILGNNRNLWNPKVMKNQLSLTLFLGLVPELD